MSTSQPRLELSIDVFDRAAQRALALTSLLPAELVEAVIDEFREIEFLGSNAAHYQLIKMDNNAQLNEQIPIGQQLANGEKLALIERAQTLPTGAQRPSKAIYLREQERAMVYKLHWLPAIIGRPDPTLKDKLSLAVDLSGHSSGQRVSRRHAQIVEANGQFYIEALAQNPTLVKNSQGAITRVEHERCLLHNGDTIMLENSQIALKFLIRNEPRR